MYDRLTVFNKRGLKMVKRRGATYSDADRKAAVEMYLSGPESLTAVAHAVGISRGTLHQWVMIHRASHPEDER